MARRSILLTVAVLIALVGTSLIVLYVQGIDARATADQELVEVLQATDVIDAGDATRIRVDLSKDNVFFGVRAVGVDGRRSPAAFPVPQR